MKTLTQPAALVILAYRFEWAMELLAELAVQLFPILSTVGLGVSGIISFDISNSPDVFTVSISPEICCGISGLVGSKKSLPAPPGKVDCLIPGCIVRVGLSGTAGDVGGVFGIDVTTSCIVTSVSCLTGVAVTDNEPVGN